MIGTGTILALVAFIFYIITHVLIFLVLARNIAKLSLSFCTLLTLTYSLCTMHSYMINDIFLMGSFGFGVLMALCITGVRIYNKIKARQQA